MLGKFKTLLAVLALAGSTGALADEAPIIFCETFDDQLQPVNAADEFQGTQVSWMTVLDEPFGKNKIELSIYVNDPENDSQANTSQALLGRISIDVNPKWTAFGIRNSVFPAPGSYDLAIGLEDGTVLAYGSVNLLEETPEEEIQPEEQYGTTLGELFNRYAPKAQN